MRKNLFLFVLAFVSAFALVSCIKNAPEPTGDVEKDGKALADYIINKGLIINSVEEYKEFKEEAEKLKQQYKDYYKTKDGDDKDKIGHYVDYYLKYHPKYEEAKKNVEKFRDKIKFYE